MSSRRPRRSRIYDLNYNIGENYYKSALDRLDEKSSRTSYLTRRSEPPPLSSPPKSRFLASQLSNDGGLDEDLEFARDRASRAIQRETILDQRTGRKGLELEQDFDSQVSKTLERIQASKKLLSNIDATDSYDNEASASSTAVYKKRVVKVTSDITSSSANASSANDSIMKWTKLDARGADDSESYAALRAKQTKARLQDIEQDMIDRNERQFYREQRAANVKKLLAESSDLADVNGLSNGVSSLKITKRTQKQITSY